jgi:hypothetical protein
MKKKMIKVRIVVGTLSSGQWLVPEVGTGWPLPLEKAIDSCWDFFSSHDAVQYGHELHVVDIELPIPFAPEPTQTKPKSINKAIRVDSEDAVHRGRKEALAHVLKICKLSATAKKKIEAVDVDMDFPKDWKEPE